MTIRLRLTLIFTLVVALLIGCFNVFVFLRLSRNREISFYEHLTERAFNAADMILEADEQPLEWIQKAKERFRFGLFNELVYIVDSSDNFIFRTDTGFNSIDRGLLKTVRQSDI